MGNPELRWGMVTLCFRKTLWGAVWMNKGVKNCHSLREPIPRSVGEVQEPMVAMSRERSR